jgi:(p)ppGpp synthase/HD superfamily hydrolase
MKTQGELWMRAAMFASRAHRGHVRKDNATPYFSHVARVSLVVSSVFGVDDEATLAIALLHDTIEDTTVDFDEVADEFGAEIAHGVGLLSKDMRLPEEEREREYDARLEGADWRVHLVKLADQYDNLADTLSEGKGAKKVGKRIEGCRRAIEVAGASKGRPEVARAIEIVAEFADRAERNLHS